MRENGTLPQQKPRPEPSLWQRAAAAAKRLRERLGLSGSTLKLIAVGAMVLDHLGAGVLGRLLNRAGIWEVNRADAAAVAAWLAANKGIYHAYWLLRTVGRLAFPIYCFLLVEGFAHTRNPKRYAGRLALFAILSEVPFDLLFSGSWVNWGSQNTFFTLLAALLAMMGMHRAEQCTDWPVWQRCGAILLFAAAGMGLAELLHSDYGAIGVGCILALYLTRNDKKLQLAAGVLVFLWESAASLAFIPIGLYNGRRGLSLRTLFYWVYPAHLLLIWLVCLGMGMAWTVPV